MTAIRQPGKINENTTLIDVDWMRIPGMLGVYLIESEESGKNCLIDGGTATEARRLVRKLEDLGAFPPDMVIITHSKIKRLAGITGKSIGVFTIGYPDVTFYRCPPRSQKRVKGL